MSEVCTGEKSATPNDVVEGQGQSIVPQEPGVSVGTGTSDLDFENPDNANETWNLDNFLQNQGEDKNPFSGLSEEHLNQLEDVLSSDAVTSLLQQADLHTLDSSLITGMDSVGTSTQGFGFDEATAHQIIQDGVREHELAVIAAAFNDHAYAMPSGRSPRATVTELIPEVIEPVNIIEPIDSIEPADSPLSNQIKKSEDDSPQQPIRRSTRVSDAQQREMAEKILQENRQKAREAKEESEVGAGEEKEEPKKGKRGRKPKAETEQNNALNTKWNKQNRRTRSSKATGDGDVESGDEEGITEDDTPKAVPTRAKKAEVTVTPPMQRISRGKWKNPLFRDKPESSPSASPGRTPPSKKVETVIESDSEKVTPQKGKGKKKKKGVPEKEAEEVKVDNEEKQEKSTEDNEKEPEVKTEVESTVATKAHEESKETTKANQVKKVEAKVEDKDEPELPTEKGIDSVDYSDFISQLETETDGNSKGIKNKPKAGNKKKKIEAVTGPMTKARLANKKAGLIKKAVLSKLKKGKGKGPQVAAVPKAAAKVETTLLSDDDVPLGQLQKVKKIKPKSSATLITNQPSKTPTSSDEEDVPLKTLSKITKSPTKLKKLKVAISSKRAARLLNKKPGIGDKLKVLKPPSQMKKKLKKSLEKSDSKDETPEPPKTPTSAEKISAKRKSRKSESEVFFDLTMTDLFKPDGVIVHEQEKELTSPEIKFDSKGHRISDSDLKLEQKDADTKEFRSKKLAEVKGEKVAEKTPVKPSFNAKNELSEKSLKLKSEKFEVKGKRSESEQSEVKVEKKSSVSENVENKIRRSHDGKDIVKDTQERNRHSSSERPRSEGGSVDDKSHIKSKQKKRDSEISNPDRSSVDEHGDHGNDSDNSGMSYEDDVNDEDWLDPETVYCLCKKPHNNRFMIQCDACEKWFHGNCVGVSETMGKEFEALNMDFVCPVCTDSGREPKPKDIEVKKFHSPVKLTKSLSEAKVTSTTTGGESPLKSPSADKTPKKKTYQPCVGKHCKQEARTGSVYCSNECIVAHAKLSLKIIQHDREKLSKDKVQTPSKKAVEPDTSTKHGTDKVSVLERKTGRIINGPTAPTESELQDWLEKHPTFEVLQSNNKSQSRSSSTSSSSSKHHHHHHHKDRERDRSKDKDRKDKDKHRHKDRDKDHGKSKDRTEVKKEEKKDEGPDPIRINVRKGLRDALANRAEHADDVLLSSSEIKRISMSIEEEMFKYFNKDVGHRYRNKYRSLVFNIKDVKNNGLFRKILNGKLRPSKLIQMSSTELASKELAEWRKMETKHTLKMIEEAEKTAMKEVVHIRKKTHKGEVELDEDLSTLRDEAEKPAINKPKLEPKADLLSELIVDTTDRHRQHLFDLNCKICTGKQAPPSTDSTPKKATVSHAIKEDKQDGKEQTSKFKEEEIAKAEEVVKEAMANVKKNKVSLPDSPKVTVRSPDSALQSGLEESRAKFTPSGPVLWKGFIHMQEFNKFFTSAYRVSGTTDNMSFPDTIQICGRIIPEQIWDYLSKIKQAGTRDICVIRFIPAGDDEKTSYVNLYSYLNSRGRSGVVGNSPKHVKDFYIIPLASHSRIPQLLLPFDGPGLEDNRPHMLIGVLVRQKAKVPKSILKDPQKSKHSSTSVHSSSAAKKARLSTESQSSPSMYKPKKPSSKSQYVPKIVTPSSGSGSEPGTPGYKESHDPIIKAYSSEDVAPLEEVEEAPLVDDSEAYSPSKVAEEEEPYDPETEENVASAPEPSSAMQRAMELTLASFGEKSEPKKSSSPKVTFNIEPSATKPAATPSKPTAGSTEATSIPLPPPKAPETNSKSPVYNQPKVATKALPSPASTSASTQKKSSLNIEKLVQQIANSTNPNEITALMVTALAASKDSTDQQKVLADLTRKVEDQKKLLAKKKAEIEKVLTTSASSAPTSSSSTFSSTATSSATLILAAPTSTVTTPVTKQEDKFSTGTPKVEYVVATKSKAETMKPSEEVIEINDDTATESQDDVEVIKNLVEEKTPQPAKVESISVSSMKPHEMPLALQALMKDVMGHGSETGIKSKKIKKKETKPESTPEKSEPDEKDMDSLAIFKNVANRDKNIIPGLDDLPIAAVLQNEKVKEMLKENTQLSDVDSESQTSMDEMSLDKDYRTEIGKKLESVDSGLDKDDRQHHSLDKDDRIIRGMLPRFIPTQPKQDWTVPASTEASDVDHRKFPLIQSQKSSTPPPPPVPLEGKFRPIPTAKSTTQDVDQRKLDGPPRPITTASSDPFGFGGQDVDLRRGPQGAIIRPLVPGQVPPRHPGMIGAGIPPRPLGPPGLQNPIRPLLPHGDIMGPRQPFLMGQPPFRQPFPSGNLQAEGPGDHRMRGPHPDGGSTKRGLPAFGDDEGPIGKKPRFPLTGGIRPPLLPPVLGQNLRLPRVPAPPGTQPVVLMPAGMPPLPDEPLPPPPLPPPLPAPECKAKQPDVTSELRENKDTAMKDATFKDQDFRDRFSDKRQSSSSPRHEERKDYKDRDDRHRYHSHHRHRDRDRDRDRDRRHYRDRDYRSRDNRR